MAMALFSKKFPIFLISILLFILHLQVSNAQPIIREVSITVDSDLEVVPIINASVSGDINTLDIGPATVNSNTNQVTIPPQCLNITQAFRLLNPSVKTILSIGGGATSNAQTFSAITKQPISSQKLFIDSAIKLARQHNFQGLNLRLDSRVNIADLLSFLRYFISALLSEAGTSSGAERLLVTVTLSNLSNYEILNDYSSLLAIATYIDSIKILAYDFITPFQSLNVTAPPAALYAACNSPNRVSVDTLITRMIQYGVPANKTVLGFPSHGYAWRLRDANNNGLFAPANGPAAGTRDGGYMRYNEIKEFISKNKAQTAFDRDLVADYCYSGTTWIGYDDVHTISAKAKYVKDKKLRGYSISNADADHNGDLCRAAYEASK